MQGDVRARLLVKLLDDMPVGFQISKCESPRAIVDMADQLDAEEGEERQPYRDWLRKLEGALAATQVPGFDLSKVPDDLPLPPSPESPIEGPVWCVSFYDEYGESYDDLHVDLAEDPDLIRALVLAKNRHLAGRRG
jgi:hypothetical protein